MGFPGSSAGKASACSARHPGSIPDLGIEPGCLALQADALPAELPGKPMKPIYILI